MICKHPGAYSRKYLQYKYIHATKFSFLIVCDNYNCVFSPYCSKTHLMLALTLDTSYPIALSLKHYEERMSEDDQVRKPPIILT